MSATSFYSTPSQDNILRQAMRSWVRFVGLVLEDAFLFVLLFINECTVVEHLLSEVEPAWNIFEWKLKKYWAHIKRPKFYDTVVLEKRFGCNNLHRVCYFGPPIPFGLVQICCACSQIFGTERVDWTTTENLCADCIRALSHHNVSVSRISSTSGYFNLFDQ